MFVMTPNISNFVITLKITGFTECKLCFNKINSKIFVLWTLEIENMKIPKRIH